MASEETGSEDLAGAAHEPRECMPCRGSGQVISNLGGTPSKVACPWCDGSGVRAPGIDAQARWPREHPPGEQSADAPGEAGDGPVEPPATAA